MMKTVPVSKYWIVMPKSPFGSFVAQLPVGAELPVRAAAVHSPERLPETSGDSVRCEPLHRETDDQDCRQKDL